MKNILKTLNSAIALALIGGVSLFANAAKVETPHSHGLKAGKMVADFRTSLDGIKVGNITLGNFIASQANVQHPRVPVSGSGHTSTSQVGAEALATWSSDLSKALGNLGFNTTSLKSDAEKLAALSLVRKLSDQDTNGDLLNAVLSSPAYRSSLTKSIIDLARIDGLTDANLSALVNVIKGDLTISNGTATHTGTLNQLQTVRLEIMRKFVGSADSLAAQIEKVALENGGNRKAAIEKTLKDYVTSNGLDVTKFSAHIANFAEAHKNAPAGSLAGILKSSDQSVAGIAIRRGLFEAETNRHLEPFMTKEEIEYFKENCGALAKAA
jgi:hypothetical protein